MSQLYSCSSFFESGVVVKYMDVNLIGLVHVLIAWDKAKSTIYPSNTICLFSIFTLSLMLTQHDLE